MVRLGALCGAWSAWSWWWPRAWGLIDPSNKSWSTGCHCSSESPGCNWSRSWGWSRRHSTGAHLVLEGWILLPLPFIWIGWWYRALLSVYRWVFRTLWADLAPIRSEVPWWQGSCTWASFHAYTTYPCSRGNSASMSCGRNHEPRI